MTTPTNPKEIGSKSVDGIEQRARELLAAQYEKDDPEWAEALRNGMGLPHGSSSLRAIAAALRSAEQPSNPSVSPNSSQQTSAPEPMAWPVATGSAKEGGWTIDFDFIQRVQGIAEGSFGYSSGMEETEATLLAALQCLPNLSAQPSPRSDDASRNSPDRDAYEGAREDLLDWKGRAQRAEARLRVLGYQGVDASVPPAPREAAQEPALPWRPIAELPASDDLFWFLRGDVVDGPRAPQHGSYDADDWDFFAPCEAPPTLAAPQQREISTAQEPVAIVTTDDWGGPKGFVYTGAVFSLRAGEHHLYTRPVPLRPVTDADADAANEAFDPLTFHLVSGDNAADLRERMRYALESFRSRLAGGGA